MPPDAPASPAHNADGRRRLLRRGVRLEAFTVIYNVLEALVSVVAGWLAGSIALVGFGLDSVIEVVAGATVGHRLLEELRGGSEAMSRLAERRALKVVGVTFLLLGGYILHEATSKLWHQEPTAVSTVGLVVALLSVLLMPALGWAKLRTGRLLGSPALVADAKETFLCSYLSLALLLGLGLNAGLGWWWADPVAALAMLPLIIHEGIEALRGAD
jgi:divalent metal cation (Fe/Co/Zn/Cd) transporter